MKALEIICYVVVVLAVAGYFWLMKDAQTINDHHNEENKE